MHQRFTDAAETGWEGFTGALTPPEVIDIPGLPVPPRRFVVKLKYRHQPFASVPVEVSTIEAGNANSFDHVRSDALRLLGLPDTGPVPCMTLPWQIAQKLHACTAAMPDGRTNDRAHDHIGHGSTPAPSTDSNTSTSRPTWPTAPTASNNSSTG